MLTLDNILDQKFIEACELDGACDDGLRWARRKPRTFADLRGYSMVWYRWVASHKNYPEVLELLAKDQAQSVRGGAKTQLNERHGGVRHAREANTLAWP